jgi:hypothetical protein
MPRAGFEPTIPASERPQTHALDRVATRIDVWYSTDKNTVSYSCQKLLSNEFLVEKQFPHKVGVSEEIISVIMET